MKNFEVGDEEAPRGFGEMTAVFFPKTSPIRSSLAPYRKWLTKVPLERAFRALFPAVRRGCGRSKCQDVNFDIKRKALSFDHTYKCYISLERASKVYSMNKIEAFS